jgi:hypothetical protein
VKGYDLRAPLSALYDDRRVIVAPSTEAGHLGLIEHHDLFYVVFLKKDLSYASFLFVGCVQWIKIHKRQLFSVDFKFFIE